MAMRPPPPRPAPAHWPDGKPPAEQQTSPLGFWRTAIATIIGFLLGLLLGALVPY